MRTGYITRPCRRNAGLRSTTQGSDRFRCRRWVRDARSTAASAVAVAVATACEHQNEETDDGDRSHGLSSVSQQQGPLVTLTITSDKMDSGREPGLPRTLRPGGGYGIAAAQPVESGQ